MGSTNRRTHSWLAAALLAAVLVPLAGTGQAAAQSLFPTLQSYYPQLSREDIDRIEAAAARLYTGTGIGDTERWRNPNTGDSGSVKLIGSSEVKGQPCRKLEYTVRLEQKKQELNSYVLNWCKTASGEWKIVEP